MRLGVLMALAELVADSFPITREQLLTLLIELEGHPDNAVPSFLGGFAVCAHATADPADGFVYTRVPVKDTLSFVTLVPDLKLSTETARGLLPKEVPFRHAVGNAQRTARIATAFALGDYAALRGMFVDHLHQPYRRVLIPGFDAILAAAQDAGALGSFLSGAGSCLMAVTLDREDVISAAMLDRGEEGGSSLPARDLAEGRQRGCASCAFLNGAAPIGQPPLQKNKRGKRVRRMERGISLLAPRGGSAGCTGIMWYERWFSRFARFLAPKLLRRAVNLGTRD